MLLLTKIKHTIAYDEDWKKERLGKITASDFGKIISAGSDKGKFSAGAITYLEGKAGERMTKRPAKGEFHTANTDYGNAMEAEAIAYFCKITGLRALRNEEKEDTHRLIEFNEFSSCTPDGLVYKSTLNEKTIFSEDGESLRVSPLETKCPPVHHRYIKMYKCTKPSELKEVEPMYYWQVMTQMIFCGAPNAYFAAYNPDFPVKMRVIEFRKADLIEDIRFFNNTLHHAMEEIKNIENLFKVAA